MGQPDPRMHGWGLWGVGWGGGRLQDGAAAGPEWPGGGKVATASTRACFLAWYSLAPAALLSPDCSFPTPPHPRRGTGLAVPSLSRAAIPTACGLLGAIIMPHNLFLHSALVHSRQGPLGALPGAAQRCAGSQCLLASPGDEWQQAGQS